MHLSGCNKTMRSANWGYRHIYAGGPVSWINANVRRLLLLQPLERKLQHQRLVMKSSQGLKCSLKRLRTWYLQYSLRTLQKLSFSASSTTLKKKRYQSRSLLYNWELVMMNKTLATANQYSKSTGWCLLKLHHFPIYTLLSVW